MKTLITVSLMVVFLITGCVAAKVPTKVEQANANYGNFPSDYKQIVHAYISSILVDPPSARYSNWKGPRKAWVATKFRGSHFGYEVCVDLNAKNRMGGYSGRKPYYFMINSGRIVYDQRGVVPGRVALEGMGRNLCNF